MTIKVAVLPGTTEVLTSLGFEVQLDSELDQLDAIYRCLQGIRGARVEYIGSKKVRADLPVRPQK